MTGARRTWPALDATLARIDAVLAEPEPRPTMVWTSTDGAPAASARGRLTFGYDPTRRPADAVVALALAQHAYGDLVVAETASAGVTVPARKYVAPPAETRPGFLGWLRRRLIGEPPQ